MRGGDDHTDHSAAGAASVKVIQMMKDILQSACGCCTAEENNEKEQG
jgi:hypothetical protein